MIFLASGWNSGQAIEERREVFLLHLNGSSLLLGLGRLNPIERYY